MKFHIYTFIYSLLLTCNISISKSQSRQVNISYDRGGHNLSQLEEEVVDSVIYQSAQELRKLLPELPEVINIKVRFSENDLKIVDGVTGWTDSNSPSGEVVVIISTTYPGGIKAAAKEGLSSVIYHEFHHLSTGWTMENSHQRESIMDAVIKEGLAVVFAETYTGQKQEGNQYPNEVADWIYEIMDLPNDANYMHWVSGEHPDGRMSIGYKAGKYLIEEAVRRSGKGVLEIDSLSNQEILKLAGFGS